MNALYAIVFSVCCVASSFRGVDLAPTEDATMTTAPITDGSIAESSVFSVQTSSQPPTVNAASQEIASITLITVPEKEPVTENIASVVTSTQVPLTSTLPDEKSSASLTKTSLYSTSVNTPSTPAQPSHIMTIPSTKPSTTTTKQPDVIKNPENSSPTSTKAPGTTTSPEDKSSASVTKSSILFIVITALFCLLHQ